MLSTNQGAVLRMVADAVSAGRICPKLGSIAQALKVRNSVMVAFILRELQGMGLLTGAPPSGSTLTLNVDLTDAGWEAVPAPAAEPGKVKPQRTGYVIEIAWRCNECGSAVLSTTKPCPMCPLLRARAAAGAEPVYFEPKQEAS